MAVGVPAREDVPRLAAYAAGRPPIPAARRRLLDTFARVPHNALRELVGYAGDGQPLARLLARAGPAERQRRRATPRLRRRHRPPRPADRPRCPPRRAITFGSGDDDYPRRDDPRHRSASKTSRASGPELVRWTWHAHADPSTCPVCWAMHGAVHPKPETLHSHRQCRVHDGPRTASREQLGFRGMPDRQPTIPTGAALFARPSASEQRAILGPTL